MNYNDYLHICDESKYLISMTTPERIVNLGLRLGFCSETKVLDLCCGYGEMLKIWNDVFDIQGVGVDICNEFIEIGKKRQRDIDKIELICANVLDYEDNVKYDGVCCTEFFGDIQDIKGTISLLEKHSKPNSKLIFGRLYSKVDNPPKELTDFDGEIETLDVINRKIRECGYNIVAIASDTDAQWENYVTWSAKRDIEHLRKFPDDEKTKEWLNKWYDVYFKYRRLYEGWALFGIEKF